MDITDQPSIAPIQRKYRTFYPDTGECADCFAETLTEVYSAALKRPGTRGVIKVMAVGGWTDCLGFEIPEVGITQADLEPNTTGGRWK